MSTEALSTEVIEVDTLASAKPVEEEFAPFEAELVKLLETAGTIQVTDESQTKQMLLARQTRLAIRQVRITVEKTHKARKQYFLDGGRRIDAVKNRILALIEPAEERLQQLEDFAAIAQQKREEALRTERAEQLRQYDAPHVAADLGKLADDAWTMILSGAKAAHEAKIEAARKAEEERIAREKAEAEERERVRMENERLRAEAERLEAERKAAEEQARRDREAAEAALRAEQERAAAEKAKLEADAKAERERMDAERRAAEEAARKEREAIEAAAAAERAAAAAELARLQAQKDAAEKAERDRIASEKAAAEAKAAEEAKAAAKAAAAPDAEKMRAYADALAAVPVPSFATETAQTKGANIATAVAQLADRIRITADSL